MPPQSRRKPRAPPRLLLPDRRGLGARRSPRDGAHGLARLSVRLRRHAAGLLDRSSIAGAALGGFLGDPKRFGADFAFTALLIGLVAGFNKGRITAATVEPQIADEGRSSLVEEWTRRASSWDA